MKLTTLAIDLMKLSKNEEAKLKALSQIVLFPDDVENSKFEWENMGQYLMSAQALCDFARSMFSSAMRVVGSSLSDNSRFPSTQAERAAFLKDPTVKTLLALYSATKSAYPFLFSQLINSVKQVSDIREDWISTIDKGIVQNHWFKVFKEGVVVYHAPPQLSSSFGSAYLVPQVVTNSNPDFESMPALSAQCKAFGKQLIAEVKAFYEVLFKSAPSSADAGKRDYKTHPLGWVLTDAWNKSSFLRGLLSVFPEIRDVFNTHLELAQSLSKEKSAPYLSVLIQRKEDNVSVRSTEVTFPLSDFTSLTVAFSFAQKYPDQLVRYLTQTPTGPISYATFAAFLTTYYQGYWENSGDVAPYVFPVSKIDELYGDKSTFAGLGRTKVNADCMSVGEDGRLMYVPEPDPQRTARYQQLLDELLKLTYATGGTFSALRDTEDAYVDAQRTPEERVRILELKKELRSLCSLPVAVNWNIGAAVVPVAENPLGTTVRKLNAAQPLDMRITADILKKTPEEFAKYLTPAGVKSNTTPDEMLNKNIARMACLYLAAQHLDSSITPFPKLFDQTLKDAGVTVNLLNASRTFLRSYEARYLFNAFGNNLDVKNWFSEAHKTAYASYAATVGQAYVNALGVSASRPAMSAVVPIADAESVDDLPAYKPELMYSGLHEQGDLRPHFIAVDLVFRMAGLLCEAFNKDKTLLPKVLNSNYYTLATGGAASAHATITQIMPFLYVFGAYVPRASEIISKASEIAKAIAVKPEDKFQTMDEATAAAPSVIGAQDMAAFPHQVEIRRRLERVSNALENTIASNELDSSILDVPPGGGKTITTLMDIARLLQEGKVKRPLIIAPNNLVGVWKSDLDQITGERFNVVLLTSSSVRTWGAERIELLLQNVPLNSLVVVSMSWLSSWKTRGSSNEGRVMLGTSILQQYPAARLLNSYAPDYIGIDESHFTKNPDSGLHKAAQAVVSLPSVRYLRLISGTIVTDKPTDLVGQVKMINPYVFGQRRDFENEYMDDSGTMWRAGAASQIRDRLNQFTSVLTYNRADWAFMLPYPVENIRAVPMPANPDYRDLYQMLFNKSIEHLRAANPKMYQALIDGDESKASQIESALQNYLQRLEQFLVDPTILLETGPDEDEVEDEDGNVIKQIQLTPAERKALEARIKKLPVSPKIAHPENGIIALLREHFSNSSSIGPVKVNAKANKVLVFCRYKRTVRAVFSALPGEFKKRSAMLTGDDKSALEKFLDPNSGVDILVCTEMTVNTGKNLQIASRIIRVETPWSPGELDQAMSRIMRPTPPKLDKKTGKFVQHAYKRDYIFLDWIVMEHTLEIAKFARIISKIGVKSKFDHYGKPAYDNLPELPMIRMNLKSFEEFETLGDIGGQSDGSAKPNSWLDVYQRIKVTEQEEFKIKRTTELCEMIPVKEVPLPKGSFKLDFELPRVNEQGHSNDPPAGKLDLMIAKSQKAAGLKPIVPVGKPTPVPKDGKKPQVQVKPVVKPTIKPASKKPEPEESPAKKAKVRDKSKLHDSPNALSDNKATVFVETINNMFAVNIEDTKDEDIHKLLKAHLGMRRIGKMVYAWMPNVARLKNTIAVLKKNFTVPRSNLAELEQFEQSFVKKKFSAKVASTLEFREFLVDSRKPTTDKKALRVFAQVSDKELYLVTDYKSQPAAQTLARKRKLPGSQAIWETAEPYFNYLCKNKAELVAFLKKIESVVQIENRKDVVREVKALITTNTTKKSSNK